MPNPLRCPGVGRDKDCVTALQFYFSRPVTDEEMRFLHDVMRRAVACMPMAKAGPSLLRPAERLQAAPLDPRDPDPSRPGIFRDHNCYRCKDGRDLSRCPTPDRPGNCGYPHARND